MQLTPIQAHNRKIHLAWSQELESPIHKLVLMRLAYVSDPAGAIKPSLFEEADSAKACDMSRSDYLKAINDLIRLGLVRIGAAGCTILDFGGMHSVCDVEGLENE